MSSKPVPVPDHDSAAFWAGCADHKLLVQRCDHGHFRYPPASHCSTCGSADYSWVESSRKGVLYSWITIVHPVPRDIYAQDVPYIVALVELEEGVRIATNLVGSAAGDLAAGMAIAIDFNDVAPGLALPVGRLVA